MEPAQPTPGDCAAIADLTRLAAALTQRGQASQLVTTPPPHLIVRGPGVPHPFHICIRGEWLCWRDLSRPYDPGPFTGRSTPPALAAERATRVLSVFVAVYHITHAPAHTWS